MSAIIITDLTKKYGTLTAVDHLSLTIEKGELFSLLGMNGAGKTTTIKMLSCLIPPTEGDAVMLGDSIRENPNAVKQKTNISPQETAVAPNLTVRENLEFIAGIYGQNAEASVKSAKEMSSRFGLDDVLGNKARTLSGGMQRRLSIAMALISDPQILFLDEPTLGLDVIARRELWASIRQLKKQVTIILTSHYLEEVEALSDRIGVMTKGKLVAVGTTADLTAQTGTGNLEDAFVVLSGGVL
ncbi:MAG: ABC transporter ATP-binding protein [Clostridiaceae bacterium]|nr:ABC transporter ATP-binding protein [Clostridiaceae bacterium]